jgi:hypothetical protein
VGSKEEGREEAAMRLEVLPRECRARSPHVKARINMEVDVTELGRLGGLARAAGMTPEQRSAHARHMVKQRWDKAKAGKKKGNYILDYTEPMK